MPTNPTESPNARFERLAAEFHAATGMLAPGKDQPGEMGGPAYDQRLDAFVTWTRERTARVERDAQRWQAVRPLLVGVDFQWGDPPQSVACFRIPDGVRVGADADAFADQCIAMEAPTHAN